MDVNTDLTILFDPSLLNILSATCLHEMISKGVIKFEKPIISYLNADIILCIITRGNLSTRDMLSFCCTCKTLSVCVDDENLYKRLLEQNCSLCLGNLDRYFGFTEENISAKSAYRKLTRHLNPKYFSERVINSRIYPGREWRIYVINEWLIQRSELLLMIHHHYPKNECCWFDYDKFECKMMSDLTDYFIGSMECSNTNTDSDEFSTILFDDNLSYLLISSELQSTDLTILADRLAYKDSCISIHTFKSSQTIFNTNN